MLLTAYVILNKNVGYPSSSNGPTLSNSPSVISYSKQFSKWVRRKRCRQKRNERFYTRFKSKTAPCATSRDLFPTPASDTLNGPMKPAFVSSAIILSQAYFYFQLETYFLRPISRSRKEIASCVCVVCVIGSANRNSCFDLQLFFDGDGE